MSETIPFISRTNHHNLSILLKKENLKFLNKIITNGVSNRLFIDVHHDDQEDHVEKQFHFRCMSPLPGSQFSGNAVKSQFVRVSLLGKGSIFGEHDAVLERNYSASVRCFSTTGKLLKIKTTDFINFLKSTSPKSLNKIKLGTEEVNEQVSKYLKTVRKIEFTSKLHMMNYTDNKIGK